MIKIRFLVITGFLLFSFSTFSQSVQMDVIGSAGESGSTSKYNVSWTIGEVVVETVESNNTTLTQGFHQPNYLVTSVEDNLPQLEFKVYPNPVSNELILSFEDYNNDEFNYFVYDIQGKLIAEGKIKGNKTIIDFSNYEKGIYFLNLTGNDLKNTYKSFKIEKVK